MQQFSRGSEWRIWDLHIHTPDSILNNQFEGKSKEEQWTNYLTKLEKIESTVLGITDYFSLSGYFKTLKHQESGKL